MNDWNAILPYKQGSFVRLLYNLTMLVYPESNIVLADRALSAQRNDCTTITQRMYNYSIYDIKPYT